MKITIDKAVLEQALDALENNAGEFRVEGAAAILREALAQPAAQPTYGSPELEQLILDRLAQKAQPAAQPTEPAGEPEMPQDWFPGMDQTYREKAWALAKAQQEPAGEPYAWHYRNKGGSSEPSKRLDADMQAANDFPQAHFITALFTRPAVPLTDEQIRQVVKKAVLENKLSWIGFNKDEQGRYTVPALSPSHYQLARAIETEHKIGGAE